MLKSLPGSVWWRRTLAAIGLLLLVVAVWSPSLKADFLFTQDDDEQIMYKQNIRELSWQNTKDIFSGITLGMYQPLATQSYALEYRFFGLEQPGAYHATNVALHFINILLVIWLSYRLFTNEKIAWLTGLLFTVWPTQVEPVAWLSCRSTLLASMFMLATLIVYDSYLLKAKRSYLVWALVLAVLAMLSKSVAVIIGPVLLLWEWYRGRLTKTSWRRLWPFFVLAIGVGLMAIRARTMMFNQTGQVSHNPMVLALMTGSSFTWQIYKLLWPFDLSPIYPRLVDVFGKMPSWIYWSALSPILVLIVAWLKRSQRLLVFCCLWFTAQIAFSIMIVPYTYQIGSDRYNYLAMLALAWPLAWLAVKNKSKLNWCLGLILLLAGLSAYRSYAYAKVWQNDVSLWTYATTKSPGSAPAWNNYSIALQQTGQSLAALAAIENGLKFDPNKFELLLNRGYIKLTLAGNQPKLLEEAKNDLWLAANKQPQNASAKFYLGLAYSGLKDYASAIETFSQGLQLATQTNLKADLWVARASAYQQMGKIALACDDWHQANNSAAATLIKQYCSAK